MTTGETFKAQITEQWALTAPELRLLDEAAATLDRLEELEAQLRTDGLMAAGSTGQPVLHPAVAEARAQRALFARLLNQLRLPDESGAPVASATHTRAKLAAEARWRG